MTDFEIFAMPIPQELSKKFTEYVSLNVLKYMYPEKYSNIVLKDKPDLQDEKAFLGVEVVEAVSKDLAQIDGEFIKYRFGKQTQNEKEKSRQIIEKNGARLDDYGISYPVQRSDEELEIIRNAVLKKIKKYDVYRAKGYKDLELFVIYRSYFMPHSNLVLDNFFCNIAQINDKKYDNIFIFSSGVLIIFNKDNNWQVQNFERDEYARFMFDVKESFIKKYIKQ